VPGAPARRFRDGRAFELSVLVRSQAVAVRIKDHGLPYELTDVERRLGDVTLNGIPETDLVPHLHRLTLARPTTPAACAALEGIGFSFAGVAPADDEAGFRLRLQHLPGVDVVRDDITVVSDFGAELLNYVLAARPHD
jgi:hypothetical protein